MSAEPHNTTKELECCAASILDDLDKILDLPSPPAVAIEVLRLASDDTVTLARLASVIETDPALTAKLVRLANSAMYRAGDPLTTLRSVLVLLGLRTVELMALAFSLTGNSERGADEFGLFDEAWQRSVISAATARHLARLVADAHAEEAFICGLLANVGKLVLLDGMAERYAPVVAESAGCWPDAATERRHLGYDADQVAALLLECWQLPTVLTVPIGLRHDPEAFPPADSKAGALARLLHCASAVEEFRLGRDPGSALTEVQQRCEQHFGMDEAAVDDLLVSLEPAIADAARVMSIEMGSVSHITLLNEARIKLLELSLSLERDLAAEQHRTANLETHSRIDSLTALANRRAFDDALAREVAVRSWNRVDDASLGIVMVDIDRFKVHNDTYGHQAGDDVLRAVGGVLSAKTRRNELAARYGGEEFVVLVPHANPAALGVLTERLRRDIEALEIPGPNGVIMKCTASFGGACGTARSRSEAQALLRAADEQLYLAKDNGRNRCEILDEATAVDDEPDTSRPDPPRS